MNSAVFRVLKENVHQAGIYLGKKPVKHEDKINIFSDEWGLRKFTAQIFFLRKKLEGIFQQNEGVK